MLKTRNPQQINRMANILDNAGQVFLGSIVLPYLVLGKVTGFLLVGIFSTFSLWIISLRLEGIIEK